MWIATITMATVTNLHPSPRPSRPVALPWSEFLPPAALSGIHCRTFKCKNQRSVSFFSRCLRTLCVFPTCHPIPTSHLSPFLFTHPSPSPYSHLSSSPYSHLSPSPSTHLSVSRSFTVLSIKLSMLDPSPSTHLSPLTLHPPVTLTLHPPITLTLQPPVTLTLHPPVSLSLLHSALYQVVYAWPLTFHAPVTPHSPPTCRPHAPPTCRSRAPSRCSLSSCLYSTGSCTLFPFPPRSSRSSLCEPYRRRCR